MGILPLWVHTNTMLANLPPSHLVIELMLLWSRKELHLHTKSARSHSTRIQCDFLANKIDVLWKEGSKQRDGKNQQQKFLKTIPIPFALAHISHPKSHHILRWHLAEQPRKIFNAPIFGIHVNQVYAAPQRHLNPTPFQQSTHAAHLPSWNAAMQTIAFSTPTKVTEFRNIPCCKFVQTIPVPFAVARVSHVLSETFSSIGILLNSLQASWCSTFCMHVNQVTPHRHPNPKHFQWCVHGLQVQMQIQACKQA